MGLTHGEPHLSLPEASQKGLRIGALGRALGGPWEGLFEPLPEAHMAKSLVRDVQLGLGLARMGPARAPNRPPRGPI